MSRLKRATTSADNNAPMMLPKCGTLFTYGSAAVMRVFFEFGLGKTFDSIPGICWALNALIDWSCSYVRLTLRGFSFFFFEKNLRGDFNSRI
jgi:hypothetical protein